MRKNFSPDSTAHLSAESAGSNVQSNHKCQNAVLKEQLEVLDCEAVERQTDQPSFEINRYLEDANASEAFAIGQSKSATESNKKPAMSAYIKAWDVQFKKATAKNLIQGRTVGFNKVEVFFHD